MAAPPPAIGQVFGHYRIVEQIGAGGMGVVYRAHDEQLDRDVALKVLTPGTLADETARRRFQKEARALAKLNHPNIEAVYEFNTENERDFLALELVAGVTMDEKLASGAFPEKQLLRLATQLTDGLAAAHAKGVLHRDLKPGNLRLTADGSIKILDFGLAKILHPVTETATTVSLSETDSNQFVGTLPYMAPEQILEGEVDTRSDVYAMGAVLYEMATGRRPFPDTQRPRLINAIVNQAPIPPKNANPRLSDELEKIILKCLDKEPENRYQSAREITVDLRRLEMASTALAGAASVPPLRRGHWARGHGARGHWARGYGALMLAIAAALLVVAVIFVFRGRDKGRFGILHPTVPLRIQSIAVLPLDNLSGDPTQEYFSDGMTEELINDLGKISNLKVISRTSVMPYKGVHKKLPDIARELNVDAIVEGTVLWSGDRVRISTQLIQGVTDRQLWSHSYESDLDDVLGLQRDVARATAGEIQVSLTPGETAFLAHPNRLNPETLEACLKGRYFWNKRNEEGFRKGIQYFQQAIDKSPNYAPAYAGLADSYLMLVEYGLMPGKEGFPKARSAALKAVELDDSLAEAHTSLAAVTEDYEWDWPRAEREFKRAIELKPGYASARQWYAEFLAEMGRFDEALVQAKKAQDIDPLSLIVNAALGEVLYESGHYEQAVEQLHKTLDLDRTFAEAHRLLGRTYEQQERHKEAIAEFEKALTYSGGSPQCAVLLGYAYARSGQKGKAEELLRRLTSKSQQIFVSPDDLSRLYASLGNKDEAFRLLRQSYEQRLPSMVNLKVDPTFDVLRPDPRFQQLLKNIGLQHKN